MTPRVPAVAFSGPEAPDRSLIDACVHCGFCLPTCPTYLLWGEEMDSPRGRIYLMKAAVEQRTAVTASFVRHFDRCLGCLACVTACPSGVQYGPLIERTRAQIERHHQRTPSDRIFRALLMRVLPYAARLRLALLPLSLFGPLLQVLARKSASSSSDVASYATAAGAPGLFSRVRASLAVAPRVPLRALLARTPEHTPAEGPERLHAAMLTGCVQQLAFGHVNEATRRVLAAEGCRVSAPRRQGCCGALALHAGDVGRARALARRTIEVFEAAGADRVVVNAAGCGSAMKEYGHLFADDPAWAGRARALAARVRDIAEVLVEIGAPRAPRHPIRARVAYHDACHLGHGQGVRDEPRAVLRQIPGLDLAAPADAEICCGSAGIYNLVQPEAAAALGARKVRHLAALSPDLIATGNPGCTLQIAAAARSFGYNWPVLHPIELVDASIQGRNPRGADNGHTG